MACAGAQGSGGRREEAGSGLCVPGRAASAEPYSYFKPSARSRSYSKLPSQGCSAEQMPFSGSPLVLALDGRTSELGEL